ncbi:MAG: hypothetical protein PGN11_05100 [Quadrisphaera sp.]
MLTWTGYLLVGMAVGRLPLQRAAVAGWLLATGAAAAVVAPLASAAALGAAGGEQVLQGQAPPSWGVTDLPLALDTFLPGATPTTTWALAAGRHPALRDAVRPRRHHRQRPRRAGRRPAGGPRRAVVARRRWREPAP